MQECNKQGGFTSRTKTVLLLVGWVEQHSSWSRHQIINPNGFPMSHGEENEQIQSKHTQKQQLDENIRNAKHCNKKRNKYSSDMPKVESDLLQSLKEVGREGKGGATPPLEGEPGVAQALCSSGSFLWDQLQHGK